LSQFHLIGHKYLKRHIRGIIAPPKRYKSCQG
jgi:hypothetical protein